MADTDTSTPCIVVLQPLIPLDQAGCQENTARAQHVANSIQA